MNNPKVFITLIVTFATGIYARLPEVPIVSPIISTPCNSGIISNFETVPRNVTPLKTYWYCFADYYYFGTSKFVSGAMMNENTGLSMPLFNEGSGVNDSGYSISFTAEYGSDVNIGTCRQYGFTGAAISIHDSVNQSFFNATTGKMGNLGLGTNVCGIGFDYCTLEDVDDFRLEVLDVHDVEISSHPGQGKKRGNGNVHHRHLEVTNGKWITKKIGFDELEFDQECTTSTPVKFDLTRLSSIRFRMGGPKGKKGTLKIDNVRFLLPLCSECAATNLQKSPLAVSAVSPHLTIARQHLTVSRDGLRSDALLSVHFFDLGGKLVSSITVPGTTSALPLPKLSGGMYLVSLTSTTKTTSTIHHCTIIPLGR